MTRPGKFGSHQSGWFDINGKRCFFRSKWEANYALFLDFLISQGQIVKWEYEVDTFWFNKIKRGATTYKPDFKIYNMDGSIEYHEVKGWLTPRSKTQLNRMRIYYPEVKLLVIDAAQYREIANFFYKMLGFY